MHIFRCISLEFMGEAYLLHLSFDPWKSLKIYNIHVSEKQRAAGPAFLRIDLARFVFFLFCRARPASAGNTRAEKVASHRACGQNCAGRNTVA